ncbi:MAG TPA: hypothetical protein VNZ45_11260, partial [Bacteroidia bacterium]|nr:hypothetical protein [Bacteroidia bacterium]
MKRSFLLIISFITGFSQCSFAQWDDAMVDNHSSTKFAIGAYGNADFNSNCITTAFAYNFLEGSYLDNNLKQQVSSRLTQINRLGFSLNYGIF